MLVIFASLHAPPALGLLQLPALAVYLVFIWQVLPAPHAQFLIASPAQLYLHVLAVHLVTMLMPEGVLPVQQTASVVLLLLV